MRYSSSFLLSRHLRRLCFALGMLALWGIVAALLWAWVPDPSPQAVRWPVSPVLLDDRGELVHARLSSDQEWCFPVSLEDMGPWLPKILIQVEDKRFFTHSGVDIRALARATVQNILARKIISGASTISSQLVRLSIPRKRTLGTKLQEFIGAWKLERSLSKEDILACYLNRAPFGGPIRGVEAAARQYFGKRAKELSLGESAFLIGLLKGPTHYRPDKNPYESWRRRRHIIRQVAAAQGFPEDLTALALEEPLPSYRPGMPMDAWHFASLAFNLQGLSQGGVVYSTLNMRLQRLLEHALWEQLSLLNPEVTAAGIIVDNRTAAIVAYTGNARFNPETGRQWVDCALALRSPGSLLKPFAYADAMHRGKIIPASLLADTPLDFGGDAPRNFDRRYRGPVTARQALVDSLNAPAVRVQRLLGGDSLLSFLREAGFASLSGNSRDYGDSLILGAGEITLLEAAGAYTGLARLGLGGPLRCIREPQPDDILYTYAGALFPLPPIRTSGTGRLPAGSFSGISGGTHDRKTRQYCSPGAAFLVADMLRDTSRLPFIEQLTQNLEDTPVAFKTGTSYGFRDAWTAAYTPRYTVAVWFGRPDGREDSHLVGIKIAAPAALRVIRTLSRERLPSGDAATSTVQFQYIPLPGGRQKGADNKAPYEPAPDEQHSGEQPEAGKISGGNGPEDELSGTGEPDAKILGSFAHLYDFGRTEQPLQALQATDTKPGALPPSAGAANDNWYSPPPSVGKVRVCAVSGAAPSPFCPASYVTRNIPEVWQTVPCSIHRQEHGKAVTVWPPELEDFQKMRLAAQDMSRPPAITSPQPGVDYLLPPGAKDASIPLSAESVQYPVHWYADSTYLGEQVHAQAPLQLPLRAGIDRTVSLLDASGKTAAVRFSVIDLGKRAQQEEWPLLQ